MSQIARSARQLGKIIHRARKQRGLAQTEYRGCLLMPRHKTHSPLDILINDRLVGQLRKKANGAVSFRYDQSWLKWEPTFSISLSLPL